MEVSMALDVTYNLLGTRKRPLEISDDGDSASLPAKIPRLSGSVDISDPDEMQSNLCERCNRIDFAGLFEGTLQRTDWHSIDPSGSSCGCVLCELVLQAFDRRDRSSWFAQDLSGFHIASCQLGAARMSRRFGVVRPWRIKIHMRGRGAYRPLRGRWHPGDNEFELLDNGQNSETQGSMTRWVRRQIPAMFDVSRIQRWINICDVEHRHQVLGFDKSRDSPFKVFAREGRFRLVDVSTFEVVVCRKPVDYLTLSYVWGGSMKSSLERSIDKSLRHDSPENGQFEVAWTLNRRYVLPTVLDSICLVASLGYQWLWIDAYCIDQSSNEDKSVVISHMASIYENSRLTIVAACGDDAKSGLSRFRHNSMRAAETTTELRQSSNLKFNLVTSAASVKEIIGKSTWHSRGWTYQEHMLSRRCLFVTADEVVFTCATGFDREAYDFRHSSSKTENKHVVTGRQSDVHDKLMAGKAPDFRDYCQAVRNYTARTLTHPGDRLDAFSGFFRRYERAGTSPEHLQTLSGIPGANIVSALLWYHDEYGGALDVSSRVLQDVRGSYHLPTWSWAGWTGRVGFEDESPTAGSNSLSEPTSELVDRGNIVITNKADFTAGLFPAWPMAPTTHLCEATIRPTLHMFCGVARFSIAQSHYEGYTRQDVRVHASHGDQAAASMMDIHSDSRLVYKQCGTNTFPAMLLRVDKWPSRHQTYWLALRQEGGFSERLGLLEFSHMDIEHPEEQQVSTWLLKYVHFEHVQLR